MSFKGFLLILGALFGALQMAAIAWWLPFVVFGASSMVGVVCIRISGWRDDRVVREIERNQRQRRVGA